MTDEKTEIILTPKMKPRTEMPNVGVQDLIDMMDFFGFSVQLKLIPKDKKLEISDDR